MMSTREEHRKAATFFVDQQKARGEVIGIVLSGSILTARIDKNSDVDIHVILSEECDYRERGNTWVNGVEIEYFMNPPTQIRSYFRTEANSPHTAHMLACGEIVYDDSLMIKALKNEAAEIINKTPEMMSGVEIELKKYFVDDYYKDLEDALINEDVIGVELIRGKIINACINIFCQVHQVRRGKDKRLYEQLKRISPDFTKLVELSSSGDWINNSSLEQLRTATEQLLGGRRTKEWKLRSPLDLR